MNICEEYAELLDAFVDGELSPEEMARVRAHLDGCGGCRAYVDDALAIRAAFPGVEDTPAPEGFAASVMAKIAAEAAPRTEAVSRRGAGKSRSAGWRGWAAAAVAACLAAAVLLASPLDGREGNDAAAPQSRSAAEAAPESEREILGDSAADAAAPEARESCTAQKADCEPASQAEAGIDAYQDASRTEADAAAAPAADERYFARLTLTAEQAGDLLEPYKAADAGSQSARYELTRPELEDLLSKLQGADYAYEELGGGGTALVEVLERNP